MLNHFARISIPRVVRSSFHKVVMRMKRCNLFFLLLWPVFSLSQKSPDLSAMIQPVDSSNILVSGDYYNWCPSAVKGEDGRYYMFYSRWPHGIRGLADDSLNYIFNGFAGWMKYSEIACAVSDKLEGPYHFLKTILKGTGEEGRWDRFTMHNPQVKKFEGSYYLYYISNNFDSSFNLQQPATKEQIQWMRYNATQSIGVIRAASIQDLLSGNYVKPPAPIMKADGKQTFEIANNPSVDRGPDGRYYMMYKSRMPGGHMKFWIAVGNKPDTIFKTFANVTEDPDMACEDPSMWYDKKQKKFYAVAKYYSNSLKHAPEFGALILIESSGGKDWRLSQHTLVSIKRIKFKNGKEVKLDRLERPFVYTDEDGKPLALFAAAAIRSPNSGDPLKVTNETNSFIVCFPLK